MPSIFAIVSHISRILFTTPLDKKLGQVVICPCELPNIPIFFLAADVYQKSTDRPMSYLNNAQKLKRCAGTIKQSQALTIAIAIIMHSSMLEVLYLPGL
jgi:uncharacterized membrane protein YbaN (DUF454 family)